MEARESATHGLRWSLKMWMSLQITQKIVSESAVLIAMGSSNGLMVAL